MAKVQFVSKSKLKAKALEYFRQVQETGREIVITDHETPVLRLIPYKADPREALLALRDSVVRYDEPTEPVREDDWESLERRPGHACLGVVGYRG